MKLLKFYAEWCGPCKQVTKLLKDNNIEHTAIDIDTEDGAIATSNYNIRTVPTLIMLDDESKEIKRYTGSMTVQQLKEFINQKN